MIAYAPELIRLPLYDRAFALAVRAHAGQRDKAGVDYFCAHVWDVAERVATAGYDEETVVVALLHDVLEDTTVTEQELQLLFPQHIVVSVLALTVRDGESRDAYYGRVRADRRALAVKEHDIASNLDPLRLALLAAPVRERLLEKYAHARDVLGV